MPTFKAMIADSLLANEMWLRIGAFVGIFALIAVAEAVFPRRGRLVSRWRRWTTNLAMIAIGSIAIRILMPVVAITMAAIAVDRGWGLLNWLDWPIWIEALVAVILLDLAIYWQHVATHRIPLLWRLHKVHHADRDFDVTTGLRFHPFEIIASMLYKIAIVALLGPSVIAVLIFELLLSALPLFNHANFSLPGWIDKPLRWIVVTPDMHRVHHSTIERETNSNYGFNLAIWDRLFSSYRDQPELGHDGMVIGLEEYQDEQPSGLGASLTMPFEAKARAYSGTADQSRP